MPSSLVWIRCAWLGSQSNAIPLPSYSCGPFYTISYNKIISFGFWSVMVSTFELDIHLWGRLDAKSSRPRTIILCMLCKLFVIFYIQSISLAPQQPTPNVSKFIVKWSQMSTSYFTDTTLDFNGHMPSSSGVKPPTPIHPLSLNKRHYIKIGQRSTNHVFGENIFLPLLLFIA